MADKWTLTIAVLALVVAALAAVIAWSQLRLQRTAAGGSGILFDVRHPLLKKVHNGVGKTESYVRVELFGPHVRYEVALHLERAGEQLVEGDVGFVKPLESRKRMSCEDQPIAWDLEHDDPDAQGLWCVLSWVEPVGPAIWTHAYARKLTDPGVLYEWRWHRTRRFRRWLHSINLAVRPLGKWRINRELHIEDGHGPFDLSFAPDQRPTPRTQDW